MKDYHFKIIKQKNDKNRHNTRFKTPSGFAKEVGIHPLQMLRYINLKKNMRFDTLIEIGRKAK